MSEFARFAPGAVPSWADKLAFAEGGHDEAATLRLFRRLRGPRSALRGGDDAALRDHLVLLHAPLVEHCARGFAASGEPLDDLVQEGYVGLIKAVDRFDPEKGIKFSTYACHLVAGEIRHYLRDLGRLIHEPGWHFELRQKIARAGESLSQTTGRAATPEEIAAHLSVKVETVREVLLRAPLLHVDSLDAPETASGEGALSPLESHEVERGGARRGEEGRVDDRMFLAMALPQLKELEQQAIRLFFFEEMSKSDIARQLGISVNYVSYLVKRGTEHLRRLLETPAPIEAPQSAAAGAARAADLLELARRAADQTGAERRSFQPRTRAAAFKPGVANLTQFALWLDEECARVHRYGGEFSVLWCQLANWDEALQTLDAREKRVALGAATALAKKQCRAVDKIAALHCASPPGLHFLVLLPATGAPGQSLGRRLETGFAQLNQACKPRIAYATCGPDGKTADELFAALGQQLGA